MKQRPFDKTETALLRVVNITAGEVAGQQIGGELNALKPGMHGTGQRLDRRGFGQAGHPFEQDMPARQQTDDQPVEQVGLPNNGRSERRAQRGNFSLMLHCASRF